MKRLNQRWKVEIFRQFSNFLWIYEWNVASEICMSSIKLLAQWQVAMPIMV